MYWGEGSGSPWGEASAGGSNFCVTLTIVCHRKCQGGACKPEKTEEILFSVKSGKVTKNELR